MQIPVAPWSAASNEPEEVEQSPNGRYIRYNILLGKGACKRVYKALDTEEGTEVAWNQVDLLGMDRDEEARQHLQEEIRVLQQLKHKNIMTFYAWWYDKNNLHINFITELFTAGNLRQYRKKLKIMSENVLKRWAHQILEGLLYLHGHTPPIVHRDLKCDNIFVNSATGEVKIGDLGLATVQQTAMSVVGTPEFMAPEVYDESYDERCDIYSFGMCLLELATLEYPYAECHSVPQIFKKVTLGIAPASLTRVSSSELRDFISLCIAHNPADRPTARDLLKHPYLECVRHSCASTDPATSPHPLLASAGASSGALPNGVGSGGAGCGSSSGTGWSTPTGTLHCAASVRDLREALHQQETLARHQQHQHQQNPHGHPLPHLPLHPHPPSNPLHQPPAPGVLPFGAHHSCPDTTTSPETSPVTATPPSCGLLPRNSLVPPGLALPGAGLLRSPSQPSPLGRTASRAVRELDSFGSPAGALLAEVPGTPGPLEEGKIADVRQMLMSPSPMPSPFLMAAMPHSESESGGGEGGGGTASGAAGPGAHGSRCPARLDPLTLVARRLVSAGEMSGGATTPSSENDDSDSDSDQEVLVPIEVLKAGLLEEGFVENESVAYFPTTASGNPIPSAPALGDPGYDPASAALRQTSAHSPLCIFPQHLLYPHHDLQQQQQQPQHEQQCPGGPGVVYENSLYGCSASIVSQVQRIGPDPTNLEYDVVQQQQHQQKEQQYYVRTAAPASVQRQHMGSMLACCLPMGDAYGEGRIVPAFSSQFSEAEEGVYSRALRANEKAQGLQVNYARDETQAACGGLGGFMGMGEPRQLNTWSRSDSSSSSTINRQVARGVVMAGGGGRGGHSRTGSTTDSVTFSIVIPPGNSGASTPMLRESSNGEPPSPSPLPLPPVTPSVVTPTASPTHGATAAVPWPLPAAPMTAPPLRAGSRGDGGIPGPASASGAAAFGKVKLPSFRNRVQLRVQTMTTAGDGERRCIRTTSARTFGGSSSQIRHHVGGSKLGLSAGGGEGAVLPTVAAVAEMAPAASGGMGRMRVARSSSLPLSLEEMERAMAEGNESIAEVAMRIPLLASGGNVANAGSDRAGRVPFAPAAGATPSVTPSVGAAPGRSSADKAGEGGAKIPGLLAVPAFFHEDAGQGHGRGVHGDLGPGGSKAGLLPVHAPYDKGYGIDGGQGLAAAVSAALPRVGQGSGGGEASQLMARDPHGDAAVVREFARPIHGVIMRLKQWKRLVKDRRKASR